MTDVIACKDISGGGREIPKVDNLCPADQKENASNQPPAEMREEAFGSVQGEHRSGVAGVQEFRRREAGVRRRESGALVDGALVKSTG